MDHAETLSYLDEIARSGIKLGLENIRTLLADLEDPQNEVPAIVVGGSNGKGSTAAFLASMLTAAGYRVGLYTSPHLVNVEERIALDQQPISPDRLADAATHVRARVDRLMESKRLERIPTFFEFLTATALHVFRREGCDYQVLEVGMGGRLDSTNVVDRPLLSIITRIDREHSQHLGSTLAEIATEKAGIARNGVPTLTFEQDPETLAALRERVHAAGSTLIDVASECQAETDPAGDVTIKVGRHKFSDLTIPLPGRHQVENLALALRALEVLCSQGLTANQDDVRTGVESTRWPGRLEVVRTNPTILLDGAHNPAGARALGAALDEIGVRGDLLLVFGAMRDKDIAGIMEPIFPRASRVFLTRSSLDRAADLSDLEKLGKKFDCDLIPVAEPGAALEAAVASARPEDTILVAGSLILVGDVKKHLERAEE